MKSILDRTFRYTPSGQTDLRKTFARIRKQEAQQQAAQQANAAEAELKVAPLNRPDVRRAAKVGK